VSLSGDLTSTPKFKEEQAVQEIYENAVSNHTATLNARCGSTTEDDEGTDNPRAKQGRE